MSKTAADPCLHSKSEIGAWGEHPRSCGMEEAAIRHLLLSGGWKENEIGTVFAQALQPAIPIAHGKGGAREAVYR